MATWVRLKESSFRKMKKDGVPEWMRNEVRDLWDVSFPSREELMRQVDAILAAEAFFLPKSALETVSEELEKEGVLTIVDVEDLQSALRAIRAGEIQGEGAYPVAYRVNARVDLLAPPRWLQDWTPRRTEVGK